MKLQAAGYSILEIGHTKTKLKEDIISKVQFEQLTCNLDNKYYNALKDKVNLVAMCYWENVVENIEEKKNAFTKKMDRVGDLTDRKRVMVFADDDNAIDTKTHFEYITNKIDLSAEGFIKAVEEAIAMKIAANNGTLQPTPPTVTKPIIVEHDDEDDELTDPIDDSVDEFESEPLFDEIEDEAEDEMVTLGAEQMNAIRTAYKNSESATKAKVKPYLAAYGNKLSATMSRSDIVEIEKILGLRK